MKKNIVLLFILISSLMMSNQSKAQLVNGAFETYTIDTIDRVPPFYYERPDSWIPFLSSLSIAFGDTNRTVYKSTDKHGGNYACRIDLDTGQTELLFNIGAIIQRPKSFTGWYKLQGTGLMQVCAVFTVGNPLEDTNATGKACQNLVASASWKQFAMNITFDIPGSNDSFVITITASNESETQNMRILIDDFVFSGSAVGVDENPLKETSNLEVYPNPVADQLKVNFNSLKSQKVELQLVDMMGKTIVSENRTTREGREEFVLDTEHLPAGIYNLLINNSEGIISKKVIKN